MERKQLEQIRKSLITNAYTAVEKENGHIETYYKNRDIHHSDGSEHEQENAKYPYSPVVVISTSSHDYPCGFQVGTLFDLHIDDKKSRLICTLVEGDVDDNDDYSKEDDDNFNYFDTNIDNVEVEGLVCIFNWLTENGFITQTEEAPTFHCERCGGTNVERQAWVKPNRNNEFVDYAGDDGEDGDNWCCDCEDHIDLIPHDEFVETIKGWWKNMDFSQMGKITGHHQADFDPADGYQAFVDACNKAWEKKSITEKIEIWRINS